MRGAKAVYRRRHGGYMSLRNHKGPHVCRPRFTYGAGEKSRTPDLRITNALLYQLSYAGVAAGVAAAREGRILAEPLSAQPEGARRGVTGALSALGRRRAI